MADGRAEGVPQAKDWMAGIVKIGCQCYTHKSVSLHPMQFFLVIFKAIKGPLLRLDKFKGVSSLFTCGAGPYRGETQPRWQAPPSPRPPAPTLI